MPLRMLRACGPKRVGNLRGRALAMVSRHSSAPEVLAQQISTCGLIIALLRQFMTVLIGCFH